MASRMPGTAPPRRTWTAGSPLVLAPEGTSSHGRAGRRVGTRYGYPARPHGGPFLRPPGTEFGMSTPSYVGVLDPDGRTYRARYAHFDGAPDTMPHMIAAVWWHTFGRDGAATGQALLAHTWEQIGPDITADTPIMLPGYRPVPGVGIAFPEQDTEPQPITGNLTITDATAAASWMYLIDLARPDTLLLFADTGRWTLTGRLDMSVGRDAVAATD